MTEKPHEHESRIDFQILLKDLESEHIKPKQKDVRQTDIADLFKKKSAIPQDKNKP